MKLYRNNKYPTRWYAFSPETGWVMFPAVVGGWAKKNPPVGLTQFNSGNFLCTWGSTPASPAHRASWQTALSIPACSLEKRRDGTNHLDFSGGSAAHQAESHVYDMQREGLRRTVPVENGGATAAVESGVASAGK